MSALKYSDILEEGNDEVRPVAVLLGVNPSKIFSDMKKFFKEGTVDQNIKQVKISKIPLNSSPPSTPFVKISDGRKVHIVEKKKPKIVEEKTPTDTDDNINFRIKGNKYKNLECFWQTSPKEEDFTNRRCEHCHRIPKLPMGRPINILVNNLNGILTFVTEGCFCGFSCMMTKLNDCDNGTLLGSKPLMQDSRFLMRLMFNMMHPDSGEIVPAPPMRLHKQNGGNLDDEEFDSNNYIYKMTPNIKILKSDILYERESTV